VGLTGSYVGTLSFGGGSLPVPAQNDAFVVELDPSGGFVWNRVLRSSAQSSGNGVRFDGRGNMLVTGSFWGTVDFGGGPLTAASSPSIFVAKYAPDGSHLWSKGYGAAGGVGGGYQSAIDAAGNLFVAASYQGGALDFGCGPLPPGGDFDALVVKLDPTGNCLWSKRFGDAAFQQTSAAAVDAAGNVIITGILAGSADFGGGPLSSNGGQDVFVAKLDANGQHLWSKHYGDAADQLTGEIAVGPSGDVALVGWFNGTIDFGGGPLTSAGGLDAFVAQLASDGTSLWSRRFGSAGDDAAVSVAMDGAGNVVLTGYFHGTADLGCGPLVSAGGADAVLAKLDRAGQCQWARRYGDASDQSGSAVAFDQAGHLYVAAVVAGSIDFGVGPLVSAGGLDIAVAKLSP
jgi:hypothetical protein